MKTAFKVLLILVVATILIISIVKGHDKANEMKCTDVELVVEDSLSLGLINKNQVNAIIREKNIKLVGVPISELNLSGVEDTLCASPYIDTVKSTLTASGKIALTVIPQIPTLHIFADNGQEYYLDRRGNAMPIGKITGNLVIATGKITKKFAKKHLAPMARYIQDNKFWRSQIQQIEVVSPTDVRLHTRISDHVVLLGEPTHIQDKLWRLKVFYQKGLKETGWNKYKTINVEYDNIVIGSRK